MKGKTGIQQDMFNPVPPPRIEEKFWSLMFGKQVIINRMPWAVCEAEKKKRKRFTKGFSHLYKIVPAK